MKPIEQFQEKHGLNVDGIIGAHTLSAMSCVWDIDDKAQLAHFLGQCSHESANFTRREENLNYSAERLREVFGKYFTEAAADICEYEPHLIANLVYGKRLGNKKWNDGYKFRGRGVIQITGRYNYEKFGNDIKDLSVLENPDCVAYKYYFKVGFWYFNIKNIWNVAHIVSEANVRKVTELINGGLNGFTDRLMKTQKYYDMLQKIDLDKERNTLLNDGKCQITDWL